MVNFSIVLRVAAHDFLKLGYVGAFRVLNMALHAIFCTIATSIENRR